MFDFDTFNNFTNKINCFLCRSFDTGKCFTDVVMQGLLCPVYDRPDRPQPIVEVGLGLYFTAGIVYAVSHGLLMTLPFLVLFQSGFLYTGLKSLLQQVSKRNVSARVLIAGE